MPQINESQESGIAFITEVMGAKFGNSFAEGVRGDGFGSPIARMAASWAFHEAWQDTAITRKEKSIALIGALVASRQPLELKNHVKVGLANGLTAAEIEGILIQLTPYIGLAPISTALSAVTEALREAGALPGDVRTAEERDLL